MYASAKRAIIGSDNGLAPGRRQAIILNQCWHIVNWTLRNKLQWNLNQNSYIFIHKNAIENVVYKMVAILSLPHCVIKDKNATFQGYVYGISAMPSLADWYFLFSSAFVFDITDSMFYTYFSCGIVIYGCCAVCISCVNFINKNIWIAWASIPKHDTKWMARVVLPMAWIQVSCVNKQYYCCRDHFVYAPSQWEMTLQWNVVSHWLGAYSKWSLLPTSESLLTKLSPLWY